MAIYHMQAKVVSRGSGRSAVAASAYMSCSRMYNDYDGIQHDYTRKHGLIYQEVLLPPMASPEWKDREQLWNAVEAAEKTKDSRLAREFVVALPIELDKDSNISLLQNFIQKNFVDMGMCADFDIHDTDGHNPHAHILLTVRPLNENGTWQYKTEKEYLCIKNGEEKGFMIQSGVIKQEKVVRMRSVVVSDVQKDATTRLSIQRLHISHVHVIQCSAWNTKVCQRLKRLRMLWSSVEVSVVW